MSLCPLQVQQRPQVAMHSQLWHFVVNMYFQTATVCECRLLSFLRRPTGMADGLNKRCWTFLIKARFSAAAQGRPSNVFWRFGHRWTFIFWLRDLAHPSSKFHRGWCKSAKFGLIFNIAEFEVTVFGNASQYLKSVSIDNCPNCQV